MASKYFTNATFTFLSDLTAHNNRDWFQQNKHRYEDYLKEPAIRFIIDFGPHLKAISEHFRADPRPVGGSMFRIYRDLRFTRDKTPYKTHLGIQFRHDQGRNAHAPGFYLHLEPGRVFAGAGIWRPPGPALGAIREKIHKDADGWLRASRDARFRASFELSGDSLVRAPKGFSPGHPQIADLRRKDFIGVARLDPDAVVSADFMTVFAELCRDAAPFQRWLCEALGVPF